MDARSLNAVDRADGARQFAFQRTQMIDVLHKAGRAERFRLVKDLVADAAALGQASFGQLHAQPGDLVLRDHDDGPFIADFERNALPFQILDDAGGVFNAEIGEQRGHLRRSDAQDNESEEADQRGSDGDHGRQPGGAQTLQEIQQTLGFGTPDRLGKYCLWDGFDMVNDP